MRMRVTTMVMMRSRRRMVDEDVWWWMFVLDVLGSGFVVVVAKSIGREKCLSRQGPRKTCSLSIEHWLILTEFLVCFMVLNMSFAISSRISKVLELIRPDSSTGRTWGFGTLPRLHARVQRLERPSKRNSVHMTSPKNSNVKTPCISLSCFNSAAFLVQEVKSRLDARCFSCVLLQIFGVNVTFWGGTDWRPQPGSLWHILISVNFAKLITTAKPYIYNIVYLIFAIYIYNNAQLCRWGAWRPWLECLPYPCSLGARRMAQCRESSGPAAQQSNMSKCHANCCTNRPKLKLVRHTS